MKRENQDMELAAFTSQGAFFANELAKPVLNAMFGDQSPFLHILDLDFIQVLFDTMHDVVFFAKDKDCRYVLVNDTFVHRCGRRNKQEMVGKTPYELFPRFLAENYVSQDRQVIATGAPIVKRLELHLYPNRKPGWCLTHKIVLRDMQGAVIGSAGISRDLGLPDETQPVYRQIASIADHIREHFAEDISLEALAQDAGLSMARVERLFQKVFHYSPRQMLLQSRLDAARAMLESGESLLIVDIAMACGYSDHSAFSRQFKASVGMPPVDYRNHVLGLNAS